MRGVSEPAPEPDGLSLMQSSDGFGAGRFEDHDVGSGLSVGVSDINDGPVFGDGRDDAVDEDRFFLWDAGEFLSDGDGAEFSEIEPLVGFAVEFDFLLSFFEGDAIAGVFFSLSVWISGGPSDLSIGSCTGNACGGVVASSFAGFRSWSDFLFFEELSVAFEFGDDEPDNAAVIASGARGGVDGFIDFLASLDFSIVDEIDSFFGGSVEGLIDGVRIRRCQKCP